MRANATLAPVNVSTAFAVESLFTRSRSDSTSSTYSLAAPSGAGCWPFAQRHTSCCRCAPRCVSRRGGRPQAASLRARAHARLDGTFASVINTPTGWLLEMFERGFGGEVHTGWAASFGLGRGFGAAAAGGVVTVCCCGPNYRPCCRGSVPNNFLAWQTLQCAVLQIARAFTRDVAAATSPIAINRLPALPAPTIHSVAAAIGLLAWYAMAR